MRTTHHLFHAQGIALKSRAKVYAHESMSLSPLTDRSKAAIKV